MIRRFVLVFAALCAAGAGHGAQARNAVGYVAGAKTTIKIVDVDGKDVEARTARAFRVMQKAAHKQGVSLAIRSGYRSFAKQAQLYKDYRRGRGNLAAPPGYSNHESGRALDLYVTDHRAYDWLHAHGAQFGFHRTVPTETWHWEYLGDESRAVARESSPKAKHHGAVQHVAKTRPAAKHVDDAAAPATAPAAAEPAPAPVEPAPVEPAPVAAPPPDPAAAAAAVVAAPAT